MTKEEIREIFIEEANEIIEKLDIDIINFENNPEDRDLLNELFRGVHTLKGSANSFGFNRLGTFVHHFEDLLDHFRNSEESVSHNSIDLFLLSVDIIKDVMLKEVASDDGVPQNYADVLAQIKKMLSSDEVMEEIPLSHKIDIEIDLASEFSEIETTPPSKEKNSFNEKDIERVKLLLKDNEYLYYISLTLDEDIFFRGLDHTKFLKLLSVEGTIVESWWNMSDIPSLSSLDAEKNFIKQVDILFITDKKEIEIEDIFEYIEKNEFTIKNISQPCEFKEPKEIHQKIETPIEITPITSPTPPIPTPIKSKQDTKSFIKIETNKLDELFDSVGELVIAQNFIAENEEIKALKSERITKTMNTLSKITRLIQNRVMSLRMIAVHDTFQKMKRVARDASKKVDKEIILDIEGSDTEIDKTMVDALSEPLIHIIRNAIDHGLEDSTQERREVGKADVGTIRLRAFHRGGNIAIEVSDDGRGINREKVLAKALEKGLITVDEELSDTQVFALIMQAGFSTADTISDISGRGVGLDVVRSSIEKLQGKIEISSKISEGTTFTILLPLTLAIIDGMIVKSANDTFIIPTLSVLESFIPAKNIIHSIKRQGEFVDLRGEMIPIVRLNYALEIGEEKPAIDESILMCIESDKGKYALLVDELIGRQQVVIKSLGPTLSRIKELSGSAIMGSGEIALILNVEELLFQQELKE